MNRTASQFFQLLITYACCRQPENVPAERTGRAKVWRWTRVCCAVHKARMGQGGEGEP